MVSGLKFQSVSVVVVLALVLCETFVESQYYVFDGDKDGEAIIAQPEPYAEGRSFSGSSAGKQFASRRGPVASEESQSDEEDDDDEEEDSHPRPSDTRSRLAGRPRPVKLPPGFNDRVNKRMKVNRRSSQPLHGDPEPIDELDEEGRQPESRLLWPFSIEITKGNKDKGWGPGGYGSYHEWAQQQGGGGGWGGGGPSWGWGGGWGGGPSAVGTSHPYGWKPGDLTDEEILNSKHYKKYRKKKKKKIKKLKKKLKFKRLVQKILQKHITYLDKIAPY